MDVVHNWYEGHKLSLASGTRRDYEGRIRRDVARIGELDAHELARSPRRLRTFYASLTPTNARRLHAILRQAFQDAVNHEEIERNPCDVVKPRKPLAAEKLIPSPIEVEKLVVAAEEEDPLWGLFLNVTATLGTRRGETCGLRWEDVDVESHPVHIRRAVCKGVNGPTEIKLPKNGRERALLVGAEFFAQIEPLRREGSQLLLRGIPVTQVARFLGHRDSSITMNLYGNHIVDDVHRAMGAAAASLFRRARGRPER